MQLSFTEVFSIDSTIRNTGEKAAAATSHSLQELLALLSKAAILLLQKNSALTKALVVLKLLN